MSVEYFLFLRKRYENIIQHLLEIKYIKEEIVSYSEKYCLNDLPCNSNLEDEIEFNTSNIKYCNQQLKSLCNHIFIKDYIDITPDTSNLIEYCSICECNKE
jgi:hypothetical protein